MRRDWSGMLAAALLCFCSASLLVVTLMAQTAWDARWRVRMLAFHR